MLADRERGEQEGDEGKEHCYSIISRSADHISRRKSGDGWVAENHCRRSGQKLN